MLNSANIRELVYLVLVDDIKPIEGRDRVECAVISGWTVMVRKGQFKPGDPAIYFEIDSKVPETEPFAFLESKHYKIKTQKYKTPVGQFWSQGLLMGAEDFGWQKIEKAEDNTIVGMMDENGDRHWINDDSRFLTAKLKVVYAEADDNKRKANSTADKYKRMAQRHPEVFSKPFVKWLMRKEWGKKLMFIFFGKKKDSKSWPEWVVKTDEERVQNIPWRLADKREWVATEKIDGTSTTFTMKGHGLKREFYICSRNVCFDTPAKMAKGAFYDSNVYQEMAIKYDIEHVLSTLLSSNKEYEFVTIQGETFGEGIQKRDYHLDHHELKVFNVIFGYKDGTRERLNPIEMTKVMNTFNVPCVPIVNEHFVMPDTVEELLNIATDKSAVDGDPREGLVFRSIDGAESFKAVSNEFLAKYHND